MPGLWRLTKPCNLRHPSEGSIQRPTHSTGYSIEPQRGQSRESCKASPTCLPGMIPHLHLTILACYLRNVVKCRFIPMSQAPYRLLDGVSKRMTERVVQGFSIMPAGMKREFLVRPGWHTASMCSVHCVQLLPPEMCCHSSMVRDFLDVAQSKTGIQSGWAPSRWSCSMLGWQHTSSGLQSA